MILKLFQKIIYIINYLFSNSINEKKFLKNYFNNRQLVLFDVGSNFGSEFDFINKSLNIKRAFLIDPSKKCYNFLKKKYSDKNIKIFNCGISDKNEEKLFHEYNVLSQSSFYKLNKKHDLFKINNSYLINSFTLDQFCKKNKINKIDFIKIDTQDYDLKVLKGATKLLKNKKINLIKIEITFNSIYKSNSKSDEIITYLNTMGYRLINFSLIKFENNRLMFCDAYFASKERKRVSGI